MAENILTHVERSQVKRVHVLGVAGTGMGSFAGLLKESGFEVTGSDENVYPPMSQMLQTWGIPVLTPYRPENLDSARPDLVIVGNVIRRVNPEATAMRDRGLPHMSFPAALGDLFLESRHSLVVAGTHGKTTTSALAAHVLVSAGRDPSFLVGGVARNYASNFRSGKGPHFVVEGDEYDTAYFDKGPKFLHYRPRSVILTSLELDHADIYRDLAHYTSSFEKLLGLIPAEGDLLVCAGYPGAVELSRRVFGVRAPSALETYSAGAAADWTAEGLSLGPSGARFEVVHRGQRCGPVELAIPGRHNVENALGVYATLHRLGLTHPELAQGLSSFTGVKRRQELRGEPGGVAVIDDFAHHPTAVRETLAAIRSRYPGRPVWALFEPRSNTSRRNIHQKDYAHAFEGAAHALILTPRPHDQVPKDEQLDASALARDLGAAGVDARAFETVDQLLEAASSGPASGEVVLVMSNGAFGGLLEQLLQRLNTRGQA